MARIHTSQLRDYVAAVRAVNENFSHPDIVSKFLPLEVIFDTVVERDIDPFSEKYFDQQICLYKEIAGRNLNQSEGELHPFDIVPLMNAPNPIGLWAVEQMAEYVRAISTMLSLSCLQGSPDILDMGAGHGLGSEVCAFTGCKVHAVDIDPLLGELSRQRAATRHLPIVRSDLNYDDLSALSNGKYSGAYFFQALHHSLRPWELIAQLKSKLVDDGVICFAGEPVQTDWWPHWGLRLDHVSLFVARQHGWFESGWSHQFIRECFQRNGMKLTFFSGGYGGEIGVATAAPQKLKAILAKADSIGVREVYSESDLTIPDWRCLSQIGIRTNLLGRPAFRQASPEGGVLLYGPYIDINPGTYEVSVLVELDTPPSQDTSLSTLQMDVVQDTGTRVLFKESFDGSNFGPSRLITRQFEIFVPSKEVEIRAIATGSGPWTVSFPTVKRCV